MIQLHSQMLLYMLNANPVISSDIGDSGAGKAVGGRFGVIGTATGTSNEAICKPVARCVTPPSLSTVIVEKRKQLISTVIFTHVLNVGISRGNTQYLDCLINIESKHQLC